MGSPSQHRGRATLAVPVVTGILLTVMLLAGVLATYGWAGRASAAKHAGRTRTIVALGDSLTAGYGLREEYSYPALLNRRLQAGGYAWRVVNAGVSGDTSAGGLARLNWVLRQPADILLVALGANDGMRGLTPAAMQNNLSRIIERALGKGLRVLLVGVRMPSNYGETYRREFEQVFQDLAKSYRVAFVPYLLAGVAMKSQLNQADGIHPNADGMARVTDTLWAVLEPLLKP